jgi:hypothetical protein
MAGYDQLHATHDMILRFMGMNFSAITDGTARISSSVGNDVKPSFAENKPASDTPTIPIPKTPEQDKAMWEGAIRLLSPQSLSHMPRSLLQCRISRNRPCTNTCRSWHILLVPHPQTTVAWITHPKE